MARPLEGLPTIGKYDAIVAAGDDYWDVMFTGSLANSPQPLLIIEGYDGDNGTGNELPDQVWVTDVYGRQYAVPNYLTPRQLNVKLVAEF